MTLSARALRTMQRHAMVRRGAPVIVALSGGPDSVALLFVLRELERVGALAVAGVAHFNHQLREGSAEADELFCSDLADELGIRIEIGRDDIRALARRQRRSIEDAAREARYAFLEGAADRLGAEAIATGHTLDDQAETFLLRLIRGAGPRGLAGILPRAGRVIRPLLEIPRAELRAYAAEHRLAFREDESNLDRTIARNQVRLELIPVLQEFSPGIVEVLAREAAIARQDEDRLQDEAIALARSIVLFSEGHAILDAAALGTLPPALATRVARHALSTVAPRRFFGFDHIERLLDLVSAGSGCVSLPGGVATRTADTIVFGRGQAPAFSNAFRFPLSIPGEVTLGTCGWAVSAQWELPADGDGGDDSMGRLVGSSKLTVPVQSPRLPLAVRNRRRGDRFRPLGMGGRGRKLQDFLVDRKVARHERDSLPLVVDGDDRIVWVVGHGVSEDFRVTEPSQGVILLKARRLGGPG
jgi:tRNA(Ile)-lysidine synthase